MLDAGKSLCALLKMVFVAFPLDAPSTPPEIKVLYQKVDDLIQKHISIVTAPQISGEDNSSNLISFVLLVIKTLTEVQKNIIDPFILVRILQRLTRDTGSSAGSHPRQVCQCNLYTHAHTNTHVDNNITLLCSHPEKFVVVECNTVAALAVDC